MFVALFLLCAVRFLVWAASVIRFYVVFVRFSRQLSGLDVNYTTTLPSSVRFTVYQYSYYSTVNSLRRCLDINSK